MSRRLYYEDPYLVEFEAHVVEVRRLDGALAAVLDATAFYPTGGGQPHDVGTLGKVNVVQVETAADGQVLHFVDGGINAERVLGKVNWERRFDHMQQHTGQHILSQAFVEVVGAETVGFHLGDSVSTLDLDAAPLSSDQVAEAERRANEVTLACQPVNARFVGNQELAGMPLRKAPAVEGQVRIVQIGEFDWSPCGGTHVSNTGQVGTVKVARVERRKETSRIYFLCGWRAWHDYRAKQEILSSLSGHLTTGQDQLMPSVLRLEARAKTLQKALYDAKVQSLEHEVPGWIEKAEMIGDMRVVRLVFDDREIGLLKETARRLVSQPGVVALLATRDDRTQFVFARSGNLSVDVGAVMRAACSAAGGRGGGRPAIAQGGVTDVSQTDRALDEAVAQLRAP